jgi:hypothetical protein
MVNSDLYAGGFLFVQYKEKIRDNNECTENLRGRWVRHFLKKRLRHTGR